MNYRETEKIRTAEAILKEGGFTVSQRCCSRPSCFDVAARKNDSLILIKVQRDIGCVSPYDSLELRIIAEQVSAASLFISEKSRDKPLEDDTVYSRYNVLAVTPKTFENIVLRGIYPLVQAGPGGYYVKIDGEAIRRRRQELGLSVGEVAEKIGISRRTLYGYEKGMAKASVTAAYNLLCTLGVPVARPVNIFEAPKSRRKPFVTRARQIFTRNKLLQKIFKKLAGCSIVAVKKAPFDFVVTVPEKNVKIIGGVASDQEETLSQRVEEILSLSEIVQAHPILITDGRNLSLDKDIPCVNGEEISKIKGPEDLCKI
ncbi:MAG: helix-turn-helix domain-containing protein [Candidatus Bathyarchaeia archaeon]